MTRGLRLSACLGCKYSGKGTGQREGEWNLLSADEDDGAEPPAVRPLGSFSEQRGTKMANESSTSPNKRRKKKEKRCGK